MRLQSKLLLLVFSSLFIPIIIIIIIAGSYIIKSNIETQHNSLNEISNRIIKQLAYVELDHSSYLSTLSISNFIKDKLWNYYNKTYSVNSENYNKDLDELSNDLSKLLYEKSIDAIALYIYNNKKYDNFITLGNPKKMPVEINDNLEGFAKKYNNFIYYDGIYLNTVRKLEYMDEVYGLIILQKGFDILFFSDIQNNKNVGLALNVNNDYLFSSLPDIDSYKINGSSDKKFYYDSYLSDNTIYNIVIYRLVFNNQLESFLIVGAPGNVFLQKSSKTILIITIISLVLIFIASISFYLFGLYIIRSLNLILKATKKIGLGNFTINLPMKRNDEIGELSKEFNNMAALLNDKTRDLEEKNKRLKLLNIYIDAVFQSLLLETFVIDVENNIILANQSAIKTYNIKNKINETNIFSIPLFNANKRNLTVQIKKVIKYEKPINVKELTFNNKIYSIEFFPVKSLENEVMSIIIIIIDITEQIMMEKALVQSEKLAATGYLASGIAHEINNPMGIILNYVQLLTTGKLTKDEEKEFFSRIESEVKRINILVEKLLNFSKEENMSFKLVNISDLTKQVFQLFEPKFTKKKIKTFFYSTANNDLILGNVDSLKQVLFNIINNAIQSIHHENGNIEINISKKDKKIYIIIKDNGEGIDKETQKKIFMPFFSTKSETSYGLGLSLSQKIIKKHNGDIIIDSEKSVGTTITLLFPVGETK